MNTNILLVVLLFIPVIALLVVGFVTSRQRKQLRTRCAARAFPLDLGAPGVPTGGWRRTGGVVVTEDARGSGLLDRPEPVGEPAGPPAGPAGPIGLDVRSRTAGPAVPRHPRRRDVGRGRGHPRHADVGVAPTAELVDRLRTRVRVEGVHGPGGAQAAAARGAARLVDPTMDRSLHVHRASAAACRDVGGRRERHRQDHHHRQAGAAARRRGTRTCCSARPTPSARPRPTSCRPGGTGSAPRSCEVRRAPTRPAWPSTRCKQGIERGVDVVIIDTAGRLHTKTGPDGRAGQGQAGHREAGPGRRGAAGARRHDRAERAGCRRRCSARWSRSPGSC